uniref:NADH-ubiquinone oxidoreductase chain 6 n=1 Tax=Heteropteryx dilatata TaxID=173795 RepID=E2RV19_HETDI|nr:NADH dehydrogenase subunit 6 [Heteropteryx dilatata]BAJ24553.1 NADH dehydrogenase subunit 6 [Heteropteryx dilatata]
MKIMLMMNTLINMMFLIMKHPLSMGMTIIMQTILISMMTGMMYKSFWFSYILFLMFIGGMMVLFIYMTSLMPNMMFSLSTKQVIIMTFTSMLILTYLNKSYNINNNDTMSIMMNTTMLMKMYENPVNISVIMLASYLLFTMITVFKITESKKGPLRMMFN